MNLFRIMQSIRGWAQAGKIDFPGAVKYLTDLGVKMDGIVHQALKNVFKEGKARDPDFGNVVKDFPIDDAGIPFNPNTLKSTAEKRGVENLFEETKVPKEVKFGKPNYELIAEREGIDVELIRGKSVREIIEYLAMIQKADGGRVGFKKGGDEGMRYVPNAPLYDYKTDKEGKPFIPWGQLDEEIFKQELDDSRIKQDMDFDGDTDLVDVFIYYKNQGLNIKDFVQKFGFKNLLKSHRELKEAGVIRDRVDLLPSDYEKSQERMNQNQGGIIGVKKADGGRVGFVDGGWADDLTGQGLALYNSMTAGGHSDQAIQDTLTELGYWTPDGEATETVESIVGTDITQGGDNDRAIRLPPRKKTPTTDFNINPAAQLTGKGRIDPMGSTYDNLAMMGPMDYKTAGYHMSEIPGQEGYVQPDKYFEPPTGILQKAKRNVLDPLVTAAGAAFGVPLGLLTSGAKLIGGMLPYNERAVMENKMLESGFALDDIGRIVATGDYNTPEGIMAGYNAAQMTADTFDKRMNKIRQSNWQNEEAKKRRINLIQQAKELWQGAQDDADKLNPVNIPFSGEGAQGGGGGTNIGGGQQTSSGPVGGAVSHAEAKEARGDYSGWGLEKGGLATMFTRRR